MMQMEAIYDPTYRLEGLERLDLLDWDEVDDAVQTLLLKLDGPVDRLCPGCRAVPGRNSGRVWDLFSYRVYQPPANSEIDPVVVGLSFSQRGSSAVQVRGDISGETLGDVLFDLPATEVLGRLAVVEKARDICETLVEHAPEIAAALTDPDRRG